MKTTDTRVKEAEKLVAEGTSVKTACARAGIHISTLYAHRRAGKVEVKTYNAKKRPHKPMPVKRTSGAAAIMLGTPEQLAAFCKEMGIT